jgi:alpha-L-rhamnosidase
MTVKSNYELFLFTMKIPQLGINTGKRSICFLFILLFNLSAVGQVTVQGLMTEATVTPLGIDEKKPAFTWQMKALDRGYYQTAYQILVTEEGGATAWDSKKVNSALSVNIPYAGGPLQPTTRYNWKITVWDQTGAPASASSWFETGLMNADPGLSGWDGAAWIGGGNEDLVFYSHYMSIYKLNYTVAINEGSTKASFVIGANDSRLMSKNKNIYQLENKKDESYVKLELDISGLGTSGDGKAKFNVYRAGYSPKDDPAKPLGSFEILPEIINESNKHKEHNIEIISKFGKIAILINGNSAFDGKAKPLTTGPFGRDTGGIMVNLNPVGDGGDYVTFGMLADIGFAAGAGQKASFSNVNVSFLRNPSNTLFEEDLSKSIYEGIFAGANGLSVKQNKYNLDGGAQGIFIAKDPSHNSTPMLRTQFSTAAKNIRKARMYVTARGIYELYLNGKRVGDDYFNPGLTQYNKTHMYQTYDVTSLITKGNNAWGAMLGEGWWSGLLSFGTIWNHFGDRQSLLGKIIITYEDGTTEVITTNDTWKYYNDGPIVYSSLDLGEIYDATREADIAGWNKTSFDDSRWTKARKVELEGTAYVDQASGFDYSKMQLIGQIGNTAGVYKTLTAKSVKEVRPGVFVYNMGQNMVGVPRLSFPNGVAGKKITLRVGETLYPDLPESGNNVGMVMMENYRAALCQDIYTMKAGPQTYQPHFTFRGYQYLEITGMDTALPLEAVQGVVISSVLSLTADYETSNPGVNKLWSNLVWSNVDNFLSVPTDCPQRNERMGWSGDINVFAHTATYVSNADQFLKRHLYAMRDVQTPAGKFADIAPVGGGFGGILWGSAGIVVPWQTYLQYNNVAVLKEHYDAMVKYIDYLQTTINKETGYSSDAQLGDWLGPQNNILGSAYLATAYHIYDLAIMTKVARILGNNTDAERFSKLHDERKSFFNSRFVSADHKTIGLVGGMRFGAPPVPLELKVADTQTSYAVGLALNAFSEEKIPYMAANLAETLRRKNVDDAGVTRGEYALMTGFIGTAWINKALSDYGYSDLSYRLLQNNQYPSWLYAIDQGATTIWERLNGYTVENGFGGNNSMNSFNHYSFGAVGQWMIAYSLGIQRDENSPGFKHFILQPQHDPTGQMTFAKGYYDSMYGRIQSEWKTDTNVLTYTTTVPANTTATLYLPAASAKAVKEGGKTISSKNKAITFLKYEKGKAVYELTSGSYVFASTLK